MFIAHLVQKYQKSGQNSSTNSWDDSENPEISRKFENACSHLPEIVANLEKAIALRFYGLYKQAVQGPPDDSSRPSWYDTSSRYKFDAWSKVSNLSKIEAQTKYCELLEEVDSTWDSTKKGAASSSWNIKPSTLGASEELEMFDDLIQMEPVRMETAIEREWFTAMRNDDVKRMNEILKLDPEILEAKDQHLAMTALSRSIDLGCENVAQFLIAKGADVNVADFGGQTPLHFAAQCHRRNLAELLIASGADRSTRDADGLTPAECCDDEELQEFLAGRNQ